MDPNRLYGANVIVEDESGGILWVRAAYGKKQFILPGGGAERGEMWAHAAVQELAEETGLVVREVELHLIGVFQQRLIHDGKLFPAPGSVHLYHVLLENCNGTIVTEPNDEISETGFFTIEETVKRQVDFGTGYLRMALHFDRIRRGLVTPPVEGRLADPVDFGGTIRI